MRRVRTDRRVSGICVHLRSGFAPLASGVVDLTAHTQAIGEAE